MFETLLKVGGTWDSVTGRIFGESEEHRRFLAAGYKCQQCDFRLLNALGVLSVNFYSVDGRRLSLWLRQPRLRTLLGGAPDTVECPKCGHRWKLRGPSSAAPSSVVEVMEIVETERSEEFFGEDRRVIDNSRSSTPLTRRISFSREWSKSCHIDFERTESDGSALSIGAKDMPGLKLSSEEKVRRAYSVSQDTKETCTEEVSCEVAAYKKLTIAVHWKRVWQHGFVHVMGSSTPLQIPFRVAVGMTFDQQQIDED